MTPTSIFQGIGDKVQAFLDTQRRIHSEWNAYSLKQRWSRMRRHPALVNAMLEKYELLPCEACLSVIYASNYDICSQCPDCGHTL